MKISPTIKILLVLIFALWRGQPPMFSSSQNTYLLHGLAHGSNFQLAQDWQTRTTDPFPAFSLLVQETSTTFGEDALYVVYFILMALYAYALLGIAAKLFDLESKKFQYHGFFLVNGMVYSATFVLRAMTRLLIALQVTLPGIHSIVSHFIRGVEATYHLAGLMRTGVAHQQLIGSLLPSVFGVFLTLSIYAFLNSKQAMAILLIAVGVTFHSSYLIGGAVLISIYLANIWVQTTDLKKVFALAGMALLLVSPVLIYNAQNFLPDSNPVIDNQAKSILVETRLPHHAIPSVWFSGDVVIQLAVLILAIYIVRGSKMFPLLLFPSLLAIALTLFQVLSGNKSLALLFPWRISTVLVPIASSIILGWGVRMIYERIKFTKTKFRKFAKNTVFISIGLMAIVGMLELISLFNSPRSGITKATTFVASNFRMGNVYLIPPDLSGFRLVVGVPVFIDYKSHPFRDSEVVEWFGRNTIANAFYDATGERACQLLDEIAQIQTISHVVLKADSEALACVDLAEIYRDNEFIIFEASK